VARVEAAVGHDKTLLRIRRCLDWGAWKRMSRGAGAPNRKALQASRVRPGNHTQSKQTPHYYEGCLLGHNREARATREGERARDSRPSEGERRAIYSINASARAYFSGISEDSKRHIRRSNFPVGADVVAKPPTAGW